MQLANRKILFFKTPEFSKLAKFTLGPGIRPMDNCIIVVFF